MNGIEPGMPCPFFAVAECQPGCWLWDMEDAPDECSAFEVFPEAETGARDFYNACLMEVMAS